MCGRVGFFDDVQWKVALSNFVTPYIDNTLGFHPSYNIAPSQPLASLLNTGSYEYTRFGLIPHWAKDKKLQPINARAESIIQKPSFRESIIHKRALIPINGFYEWRQEGKYKIPYWISPTDSNYFALAGIYDTWHDNSSGEIITSSAIITTTPNSLMEPIHDRMPVILHSKDWKLWLDKEITEADAILPLLKQYSPDLMQAYEVSSFVNAPANNTSQCIVPQANGLF
ncbi:MAG: SOS response-associated peptidase [Campylobacterota bacterium]|nr:SOS response-associated peptidase [Campylobacterota bacterium]